MNDNQKLVIYVAVGVVLLMLCFPPFHQILGGGFTRNAGYNFILDGVNGTVDVALLAIQWIGVLVIAAGLVFTIKDK